MLSGKTALITGGVKNLGAEIAFQLAGQGANLALHYNSDKSKEEAINMQRRLQDSFPKVKVVFYQANLITAAAVNGLFASVIQDFERIDIVVNTVGKVLKKAIAEISEAEYDESKLLLMLNHREYGHVASYKNGKSTKISALFPSKI